MNGERAGLQKALGRYIAIGEGRALAAFQLSKKIKAEKAKSLAAAWREHARALKAFDALKKKPLECAEALPAPGYSLLDLKRFIADALTEECVFCERRCKADRKAGKLGHCRVAYESRVATAFEHLGEERILVPSGTIFFAGCNFHCCYCQNWDISQSPLAGEVWPPEKIAAWIDGEKRAELIHNANLVGGEPTPNLHNIIAALGKTESNIPVVWNSNMYMSAEAMELLHGAVDVFLGDLRYGNDACAEKLSLAPNYFATAARNFLLGKKFAEHLIRVLILPNHVECCAKPVVKWIAENLGNSARTNLMSQYRPEYKAFEHPELSRRLTREEFEEVVSFAKSLGLWNLEVQRAW